MYLTEWRKFRLVPCLAEKNNAMTARVSMLLKWCASLTCFRACFLPGRAKDLPAPRQNIAHNVFNDVIVHSNNFYFKYYFFTMAQQSLWFKASSLSRIHDHTQTH